LLLSRTARVRGRFNFRSGSWRSDCSAGEPTDDSALLFLAPEVAVSKFCALSKSHQARACSGDAGVDLSRTGVVLRDRSSELTASRTVREVAAPVAPDVDVMRATGLGWVVVATAPVAMRRLAEFSRSSHSSSSLVSSDARRWSRLKLAIDGSSSKKSSSRPAAAWIRLLILDQAGRARSTVERPRCSSRRSSACLARRRWASRTRSWLRGGEPGFGDAGQVLRGITGASISLVMHPGQNQLPAGISSRPRQAG
jgi:hypothetical protein